MLYPKKYNGYFLVFDIIFSVDIKDTYTKIYVSQKITKIIAGATIGSLALIGAVIGGCLSAAYYQPTVSQEKH